MDGSKNPSRSKSTKASSKVSSDSIFRVPVSQQYAQAVVMYLDNPAATRDFIIESANVKDFRTKELIRRRV